MSTQSICLPRALLLAAVIAIGACAPTSKTPEAVAPLPPQSSATQSPPTSAPAAEIDAAAVAKSKAFAAFLPGYLTREQLPNSLALVPPPPAAGSAREAADREQAKRSVELRDTPRWQLAIDDANLELPHAAGIYSCALGVTPSESETPVLYTMLRRTMSDAGFATYMAKNHYQRPRPFTVNRAPLCTPEHADILRKDGSYPSGHSALGWAWALVLAELSPAQTDAILARGRAFGDSRSICNVHWASDIAEGRIVGTAVVARLHAEPAFRADLEKARIELDALRAKGGKPDRDCAAEAAALAIK